MAWGWCRAHVSGNPGLAEAFKHTRRRIDEGRYVRVKPRHGEFWIQFHRFRHRGRRLRGPVGRSVEGREASIGFRRAIPRVDGFEAFLDRRIVTS